MLVYMPDLYESDSSYIWYIGLCDLYESDSSPCDINHQKDYTAWTSYDKNNFLLLFRYFIFR